MFLKVDSEKAEQVEHCYVRWTLEENVFRAFMDVFCILIAWIG